MNIITKNVIFPTDMIVLTDRDAPRSIIATLSIFLDVNFNAGSIHEGWKKLFIIVPINSAMIDVPNSGYQLFN